MAYGDEGRHIEGGPYVGIALLGYVMSGILLPRLFGLHVKAGIPYELLAVLDEVESLRLCYDAHDGRVSSVNLASS